MQEQVIVGINSRSIQRRLTTLSSCLLMGGLSGALLIAVPAHAATASKVGSNKAAGNKTAATKATGNKATSTVKQPVTPEQVPSSTSVANASADQQYQPSTPQACIGLEGNAERLSCYDSFYARPSTPVAATAAVVESASLNNTASPASSAVVLKDTVATTDSAKDNSSQFTAKDVLAKMNPLDWAGQAPKFDPTVSLLDRRWELSEASKLGTFHLRAYKPVYVLPAIYTSDVNKLPTSPNPENQVVIPQDSKHAEAKFQLSLKTKAVEGVFGEYGDLWLGYTQSSRWQVYDSEESRPFRETNYEPEASLIFKTNYNLLGLNGRLLGVSLNHQSNGRSLPLSRSWNRAILNIGFERDNFALMIRPWYRFKETDKDNDNKDIEDYVGRGDLQAFYKYKENEFSLMLRHSLRSGDKSHGAAQFDWAFPIKGALRGYVQVFDGYGESLIDYNHRATYVGVGVSLLNWY